MLSAPTAFRLLLERYGPQRWWPADTAFEVVVGAMLMHRTSWRRVEEAIANLRSARLLSPLGIAGCPLPRLRTLLRPAGLYSTKPRRLRALCRAIVSGGGLPAFLSGSLEEVRTRLLALEGVGEETADSVLLYAAGRPTFVIDAYTRRIARRLGWFDGGSYGEAKAWFEGRLPREASVYNELHALLVAHAKALCRPRPRCPECPLLRSCPHGRAQVYPRASASRPR